MKRKYWRNVLTGQFTKKVVEMTPIDEALKRLIVEIQAMPKAFIYSDKSVGSWVGEGTYISLEAIEKQLPEFLRSELERALQKQREEFLGMIKNDVYEKMQTSETNEIHNFWRNVLDYVDLELREKVKGGR